MGHQLRHPINRPDHPDSGITREPWHQPRRRPPPWRCHFSHPTQHRRRHQHRLVVVPAITSIPTNTIQPHSTWSTTSNIRRIFTPIKETFKHTIMPNFNFAKYNPLYIYLLLS